MRILTKMCAMLSIIVLSTVFLSCDKGKVMLLFDMDACMKDDGCLSHFNHTILRFDSDRSKCKDLAACLLCKESEIVMTSYYAGFKCRVKTCANLKEPETFRDFYVDSVPTALYACTKLK